jgi:hypothetical protein
MEALQFFFDAEAPDDGLLSKDAAFRKASKAINTLALDPSAWPRLLSDYGCEGVETWTEGRAPRELEALLEQLAPGEITDRPVERNSGFVIAMAVDPSKVSPVAYPRHDLPAPVAPDLDYFSGQMLPAMLREIFRGVCEDTRARLLLSDEEATALQDLHDAFSDEPASDIRRRETFISIQRRVQDQLGNQRYAQYQQILAQHLENLVLSRNLRMRPFQ